MILYFENSTFGIVVSWSGWVIENGPTDVDTSALVSLPQVVRFLCQPQIDCDVIVTQDGTIGQDKMAARATPIIGAPLPHPQIYSAIRSVLARVSRKRASEVRKDVFKTYSNGPVALFTVGGLVMKPAAANTDKDRTR